MDNKKLLIDKIFGCLIGGAIGDAAGRDIEFLSTSEIEMFKNDVLKTASNITDDTQMTLFTIEGVMKTPKNNFDILNVLKSYHSWMMTQGYQIKNNEKSIYHDFDISKAREELKSNELYKDKRLHKIEAPGMTCLQALSSCEYQNKSNILNNSKGCGGVMRVAPIGLMFDSENAFDNARDVAMLTHGHPTGYISSGAFAVIIAEVMKGRSILQAAVKAMMIALKEDDSIETINYIKKAIDLYESKKTPSPELIESELGGGWVGEEALAIALYAALIYENDFDKAIRLSAIHSGDSDSTAAICGNILGAKNGAASIDEALIENIIVSDIIRKKSQEICEWLK